MKQVWKSQDLDPDMDHMWADQLKKWWQRSKKAHIYSQDQSKTPFTYKEW
jgi:uncharacterized protein YijF (DUF1287 family)